MEEENIQFLLSEESQDLTNDENNVYLDEKISKNSRNISKKIKLRNVNNTTRRNFR